MAILFFPAYHPRGSQPTWLAYSLPSACLLAYLARGKNILLAPPFIIIIIIIVIYNRDMVEKIFFERKVKGKKNIGKKVRKGEKGKKNIGKGKAH